MKFEKNSQYFNIALYAFLAIAASMIFYEVLNNAGSLFIWLGNVTRILQPVIIGSVLAYLLNPMLRFFDDRLLPRIFGRKPRRRVKRGIAIALTYLVALIFVGMFVAIVLPQLVLSIKSIFIRVPDFIQIISSWYGSLLGQFADMQVLNQGTNSDMLTYGMIDKLMNTTQGLLEKVYAQLELMLPTVILATTKITTGVLNTILGIIISIYLLFDREKLFAQSKKIMTAIFPPRINAVLGEIAYDSHRIFSGFIVGKIIDSVIIGIMCFIGMCIFRMEYAMLISVIVGVTNVIPYFGPFIGAIPGALILYIVEPRQAMWFLVFIFLLQQFDGNILGPKILGDTTGLSAFWVIFSITLFSGIFGIIGMFIGVPLFALVYSLAKRLTSFLLKQKGEPVNTRDYDSDANPLLK